MSNIIGIVVVVLLIGFLAAFGLAGRGTFGGKSIAELPLTDDGVRIELAPASGPLRFVIHGVYRTTITGGPRTNRYRASLSLDRKSVV